MNEDLKNNADFQNEWFAQPAQKKLSPVQQNFEDIRKYAYEVFDKLDTNGNGYIERAELMAAFESENTDMRDKSYIMFLLNNQAEISDACLEGSGEQEKGISRLDIEMYFKLVINRLGQS